jgi:streptogramin lyase
MGQVYRARDPRLEREVAVKVLTAALAQESGYLDRFRREARAVAKLNHPNVVQVYDFGEQGDLTYLVMPLISGGTLRDYLAHRHILPLAEAASIIEQVASALQYAHERGLVHRDVKPANILMSGEGRVLLSDFGIVRLVQKDDSSATLTRMGAFVGSPEYAAPEMILGQGADHRADVYALGVVLFQMLTGKLPFSGATPVSLMMMQAQQPPPPPRSLNQDIPPAVEAVVLKTLAKKPEERYQTAAEFLAALRAATAASTAGTRYGQTSAAGTIGDLPTLSSTGMPPAPGSGPAIYSPAGPGSGPPPMWGGPGGGPSVMSPMSPTPQAGWAAPGSGPAGWATPGSGPAAAPPLPPTYATGVSALPYQPPISPPPSPAPRRRWLLSVLLLALAVALVAGGGATLALAGFFNGKATPTPIVQRSPGTTPTAAPSPTPTKPAGTITEVKTLAARSTPVDITLGPDNNLWFTERNGNQIGRITPQGSLREYGVPTAESSPQGITVGPDNNLWFTEYAGNQIGRITPQGGITEYPVPTANSQPWGITLGPDNNLWFTERDGNRIGRITPQGDITEYPVPTANGDPLEIITGPDGALWFTGYHSSQIGRITPQGDITEYPVPTANSKPWGITAGPDNNLWFVEDDGNRVGRISTQGVFKEYRLPTANSHPVDITLGPDNNLWFTEQIGNRIGRISTQGVFKEYRLPTANDAPWGITVGPDNNLWFVDATSSKIGRITSGK